MTQLKKPVTDKNGPPPAKARKLDHDLPAGTDSEAGGDTEHAAGATLGAYDPWMRAARCR